jgi:hypothetical protein
MMNKYTKWYNSITENAKTRIIDGYTESHHIVPKSMGGDDSIDNKVELTAREHFICHWLLTKMTSGDAHYKMLNALRIMRAESPRHQRYKTKITARVYANLKEEYSKLNSERFSGEGNGFYGKHHSDEAKARISAANKGRVQPLEEKERQKAAITGRKRAPFSDEWKTKLSESKRGEKNNRYGVTLSAETREKISAAMKGRKQTPELIAKRAAAVTGSKREKKLCPYCNQLVAVNGYARWHGDICKHNK